MVNNLKLSINLHSSISPLDLYPRGYSSGLASGLGQPLRLPAKANPLADVIGQTSPQGLQSDLGQATQPKLTQPYFVLNPRIRKFRHPRPLLIDSLSFRRLHLRLKCYHLWRRSAPYQRSASLRPRATLSLKLTPSTLRSLSSVATPQRRSLLLLRFIKQVPCPPGIDNSQHPHRTQRPAGKTPNSHHAASTDPPKSRFAPARLRSNRSASHSSPPSSPDS